MSDDGSDGGIVSDLVEQAGDVVSSLLHSVPAVVLKNALKAVGRLSTAAVSVPAAWLEGKAAETRATSQARVKLIRRSAEQIAQQMHTDPEYVRAAGNKFAEKIVRERVNLDQITEIAVAELSGPEDSATAAEEAAPISDDWLNVFEAEAGQMSSEQMQLLFGKILAGEIRKPSSYSIKTLKMMSQLDNRAAVVFRLFCSLAVRIRNPVTGQIYDARVISFEGNAAQNGLASYGLSFTELNLLEEYGLIISDYNSYMDFTVVVANQNNSVLATMFYAGQDFGLAPKAGVSITNPSRVHGVQLTHGGREILPIVDVEPNVAYTTAMRAYFDKLGFTVVPVNVAMAK
jgi:hypothetical protein